MCHDVLLLLAEFPELLETGGLTLVDLVQVVKEERLTAN